MPRLGYSIDFGPTSIQSQSHQSSVQLQLQLVVLVFNTAQPPIQFPSSWSPTHLRYDWPQASVQLPSCQSRIQHSLRLAVHSVSIMLVSNIAAYDQPSIQFSSYQPSIQLSRPFSFHHAVSTTASATTSCQSVSIILASIQPSRPFSFHHAIHKYSFDCIQSIIFSIILASMQLRQRLVHQSFLIMPDQSKSHQSTSRMQLRLRLLHNFSIHQHPMQNQLRLLHNFSLHYATCSFQFSFSFGQASIQFLSYQPSIRLRLRQLYHSSSVSIFLFFNTTLATTSHPFSSHHAGLHHSCSSPFSSHHAGHHHSFSYDQPSISLIQSQSYQLQYFHHASLQYSSADYSVFIVLVSLQLRLQLVHQYIFSFGCDWFILHF